MAKSILAIAANCNKTYKEIVGTYLLRFAYIKATFLANFIYDRFIKELIKVFFTLLLKK
jgi:hypothetical protein